MDRCADYQAALSRVANKAEVIIAKNRQGPVKTVETKFDAVRTSFENLAA